MWSYLWFISVTVICHVLSLIFYLHYCPNCWDELYGNQCALFRSPGVKWGQHECKKIPFCLSCSIMFTHIHLSMHTLFGCKAASSEVIIHGSRTSLLSSQCSSGQLPLKSLHHCEFHGLPLTLLSVSTNIPVPMCSSPLKCLVVWPRAWRIPFV